MLNRIDIENIIKNIVADEKDGVVKYQTTPLLECVADATKLSEYKNGLVKAFNELKDSPEATEVVSTFQQLEKVLPKARNEFRALQLLGVVPGRCRLCEQFGI